VIMNRMVCGMNMKRSNIMEFLFLLGKLKVRVLKYMYKSEMLRPRDPNPRFLFRSIDHIDIF